MAIIASLSDNKLSYMYNSVKMTHKIMYSNAISNGCWAWIWSLLRAWIWSRDHFKATETA